MVAAVSEATQTTDPAMAGTSSVVGSIDVQPVVHAEIEIRAGLVGTTEPVHRDHRRSRRSGSLAVSKLHGAPRIRHGTAPIAESLVQQTCLESPRPENISRSNQLQRHYATPRAAGVENDKDRRAGGRDRRQ